MRVERTTETNGPEPDPWCLSVYITCAKNRKSSGRTVKRLSILHKTTGGKNKVWVVP